jgi:hypothetical protein
VARIVADIISVAMSVDLGDNNLGGRLLRLHPRGTLFLAPLGHALASWQSSVALPIPSCQWAWQKRSSAQRSDAIDHRKLGQGMSRSLEQPCSCPKVHQGACRQGRNSLSGVGQILLLENVDLMVEIRPVICGSGHSTRRGWFLGVCGSAEMAHDLAD